MGWESRGKDGIRGEKALKQLLLESRSKWKLAAIFSFSFTLCFTVLLFTPLDLFLNNPTYFIVSWKFLFWPLLAMSFVLTIVVSAVCILLWLRKTASVVIILLLIWLLVTIGRFVFYRFITFYVLICIMLAVSALAWILLIKLCKKNALDVALHFAWGVVVSMYVQMLFLNSDMVMITGEKAGYGSLTPEHILNLAICVIIIILPLCLRMIFKVKKIEFKYEKAFVFTMLLISGMQVAGLVSTAASAQLPVGYDEGVVRYLSYEPVLNLSNEDNIIVFVLDRLDVAFITETLDEYPELYEHLEGFTLYKNNVSQFGQTFPSVTTMLTQHYYNFHDRLTFSEYWNEAWAQHTVIDTLRENGFTTNLYLDISSTYGNTENIYERTDNIRDDAELKPDLRSMLVVIGRLSLGRSTPYLLKNYFLAPLDSSFGNKFFVIATENKYEVAMPSVSRDSDMEFYRYITFNELSADSAERVLNFIHMNCSHVDLDLAVAINGYRYDEKQETIVVGGNYVESTYACFRILDAYFEKMKNLGVYDNSTIILLGDHGVNTQTTTGLLIKPAGSSGPLKIDFYAELSDKYLGASILESAGIPHEGLGVSYFDIIGGATPPVRTVYDQSYWWTARGESEMVSLRGVYEISGDANDFNNWKYIEAE